MTVIDHMFVVYISEILTHNKKVFFAQIILSSRYFQTQSSIKMENIKAIICDIEGTTTSISFVKDVLFKIAAEQCQEYLKTNFNNAEIQEIIKELCQQSIIDGTAIETNENDRQNYIESVNDYIQQLIKSDRKIKALKSLQGKIWREAYKSGIIKGHVFEDVKENFEKWTEKGLRIYIYSSGSVQAQKLIFRYSTSGDLCEYISGYFDTNFGHKQEASSYQSILKSIELKGENALFLSDIPNEVIAADAVKIKCIILDRPNNPTELSEEIRKKFKVVKNFNEIEI